MTFLYLLYITGPYQKQHNFQAGGFFNTLEAKTSSVKIFVGENFRRQKFRHLPQISSLFTDENFNLVFYMTTFL